MVGNYLTETSNLWSIIAIASRGCSRCASYPSRFFQRLENPPEWVRWFSQQKTHFFPMGFPVVFPIFYGCHFGTNPIVASHGVKNRCRRARQRSTSLSSAASWRSTTRKWRLVAAGGGTKTSAQSYQSYFYPSSSKRYPPSQQDIVTIDSDYRPLL